MTIAHLYAFGGVIIVSLLSLVGLFTLSLKEEILKKYISLFHPFDSGSDGKSPWKVLLGSASW